MHAGWPGYIIFIVTTIGTSSAAAPTATVVASAKAVLLHLPKQRFQDFTKDHPKILEYLSTVSLERQEELEQVMDADGVILEADDLIIL